MRIRSIMPDFWRSEDVGSWDWATRLFFIGLWSYVDDNGVGRDSPALIASDLFPYDMERDPRETLARVTECLATLSGPSLTDAQVHRFDADGRRFLFIVKWDKYQRVDKPGRQRYERPTWADAFPPERVARPSRRSRESVAPGEGEKGRRGEVTTRRANRAVDAVDDRFNEFWDAYPKRVGKGAAVKAWAKAVKAADADTILTALKAQGPLVGASSPEYIRHPSTWLNQRHWEDEPVRPLRSVAGDDWAGIPRVHELRFHDEDDTS